jgi:carboxyl-terminal processing protease
MSPAIRHGLVLFLGLILGVSATVGQHLVWADKKPVTESELPLDELRNFTEVLDRIKKDYVEPVQDKTLLESAIRGMLSGLDPHSAYLDAEAFSDLQVGTSGEFGGLGVEVGMEDGFIKVISPIDDTPAQRAGVMAGDLIIRLDDTPVKGMNLNEAVKRMRGKPNTKITLTIVRQGQEKPLKITLVREIIQVKSVKDRLLEPGFGYVRITQFQSNTAANLNDALAELKKQNANPLKGLILDLRNNPGGVLNAAVEVSDSFLEKGLIVYTEGRDKDAKQRFFASPGDTLKGAPMIVLVNGGSASASEIVAGALQDQRRAIIMGEPTFGKGSVQTILPLSNGTALKLTTALYYTPNGRSIQAEGIDPDIKLPRVTVTAAAANSEEVGALREADLSGHLQNGKKKDGKTTGKAIELSPESPVQEQEALAVSDYQLSEALNLLKGLALLQESGKG